MHNIDSDVRTTGSEELMSEAGGGGFVEVATECAGSRSGDGPGGTSISVIGATVLRGSVED